MRTFAGRLSMGESVAVAAKNAAISTRMASKWLHDETFSRVLTENQPGTLETATQRLKAGTHAASECLLAVIADKTSASTARVSAARAVLEHTPSYIDKAELEARLAKLEGSVTAAEESR
jgi:hypothetical protein